MAISNEYKFFRDVNNVIAKTDVVSPSSLNKRYDEPTYMTFRVMFGEAALNVSGTLLTNTNYDRMPHPLFVNRQVDSTQTSGTDGRNVVEFNREMYSTIDFLRDSNEFTRAEMLKEFITVWNDLQNNYQWYFQSIEGVGELLKIDTTKGKRISDDVRLTFNLLEGLDHRVSYLLNLYRKIAWDDIYQRWVLPDMMRFFDIKIYITEFRTFHQSIVNPNSDNPVYLQVLNGILPTYLIECLQCEFDLNSYNFSYREKLSIADNPEMSTVSFKVKVGNINEITTYPLFNHFLLNDYKLNGNSRSVEKGIMKDKSGRILNDTVNYGGLALPIPKVYSSTQSGDLRYRDLDQIAQGNLGADDHVSGTPYIQFANKNVLFGEKTGGAYLKATTGEEYTEPNPMDPATWVGNAITFGKSFTVNFITSMLNKGKMMKIPGLGFSFNQAVAAIESKDFVQVFGLIRRAIAEAQAGTSAPSSQLEYKIDTTFKEFLTGVSQSEATDGDELLFIKAANQILSDGGQWNVVKDYSMATNMRGPKETNIPVRIEGANTYKSQITGSTNNDRSWATDLDGAPKPIKTGTIIQAPPSAATSGRKPEGNNLQRTNVISTSTTNIKLTDKGPNTEIFSESTDGDPITGNLNKSGIQSEATDGDLVNGNLNKTDIISQATNKFVLNKDQLTTDVKSEATDGDAVKGGKYQIPNPSQATNNNIEKI